jgi:hypothetical protein
MKRLEKLEKREKPELSYLGPSIDLRTNRWRIDCTCGYENYPPTTRMAIQHITCGHCQKEWRADYNAETLEAS